MKEILNDPIFEKSVKTNLDKALKLVQNLIDVWNAKGFDRLTSTSQVYDLIAEPEILFTDELNKMMQVPAGLTESESREFLNNQQIPSDKDLHSASQACRNNAYCQRKMNLFHLKNGSVELSANSQELVKQKSVYAVSERQIEFYDRLQNLINELNNLNEKTNYQLITGRELGSVFATPLRDETGEININSEALKQLFENFE